MLVLRQSTVVLGMLLPDRLDTGALVIPSIQSSAQSARTVLPHPLSRHSVRQGRTPLWLGHPVLLGANPAAMVTILHQLDRLSAPPVRFIPTPRLIMLLLTPSVHVILATTWTSRIRVPSATMDPILPGVLYRPAPPALPTATPPLLALQSTANASVLLATLARSQPLMVPTSASSVV